jgi:hypothetical protein
MDWDNKRHRNNFEKCWKEHDGSTKSGRMCEELAVFDNDDAVGKCIVKMGINKTPDWWHFWDPFSIAYEISKMESLGKCIERDQIKHIEEMSDIVSQADIPNLKEITHLR